MEGIKNGGSVIRYQNATYFVPANTKDMYYVPRCQMCNMNFCNKDLFVTVTDRQFKTYTNKGEFTCQRMEEGRKQR